MWFWNGDRLARLVSLPRWPTVPERTVRTALHCSTGSTTHSVPRRYVGAWQNGVPHGRGNMTWADDDELITFGGQWRDGLPEGRGTMVYRLSPTQRWPIA